jgi:dipeptidyl aminopeptidase/acylaminoacyl peptidase
MSSKRLRVAHIRDNLSAMSLFDRGRWDDVATWTSLVPKRRRDSVRGTTVQTLKQYEANVISFDGAGQSAARHRDGLLFRPDWEHVISPVLDWTLERADVDGNRVALLGISMGGYFVARAAAFEHRLAACIAVDGTTISG